MRKIVPICFYIISILGMLLYSFYDVSKYPSTDIVDSEISSSGVRSVFGPIAILVFLVFIGLVIYEARIIAMSNSSNKSQDLAITKKNYILFLSASFAVLNIVVLTNLALDAIGEQYEALRLVIYICCGLASNVPLILAIIIRIGKYQGKSVKTTTVIASIFASTMGASWIVNTIDRMFNGLSTLSRDLKVVIINLIVVILMLGITIVFTLTKKNQLKCKWILATISIVVILNVPLVFLPWHSKTQIHLPLISKTYPHYSYGMEITDKDAEELSNDLSIFEYMRVSGES